MKLERLGNYIKQIRGLSYKPDEIHDDYQEGRIAVLKANNIQDNVLDDSNLIYIEKAKTKAEQKIHKGDILIAASSGSKEIVGKNIYFRNDYDAVFGAFCKVVRPNEKVNSEFISHFFKTPTYKNHIRNSIQGANINNLKNEHIDELKLVIPSLSEQKHIAEVLSKAEALIAERKQSIQLLDEYLKSTFLEMFGDPVKNEKGWEKEKFGMLVKNENSKRIPIKQADRDKREGEYPYYGATGIIDTIDDYKFDGTYLLIAEDGKNLLFRKRNNAFMAYGKFWVNNHAHVLSFNGMANLRYLEYFLNSIDFGPYISGIDQIKLNRESLDKIPVPFPPSKLQTQFAAIVEKTEALKAQYKEHLQSLEQMYGALSQRAFRGDKYSKH